MISTTTNASIKVKPADFNDFINIDPLLLYFTEKNIQGQYLLLLKYDRTPQTN